MGVLNKKEEERLFSQIEEGEKIEKEASFSWDGKNLILRFPKDLADFFDISKENRFTKNIRFVVEDKDGMIRREFEIVDRTRPKRRVNKKTTKQENGTKKN